MAKKEVEYYIGSIVGGAIGDALGAPIEFINLSDIIKTFGNDGVNDYVEFSNGKGEITDDTQMLLFTAEGLLRSIHRSTTKGIWGAYQTICHESYLRWLYTQNEINENYIAYIKNGWLLKEDFLYCRRAPGNTCLSALKTMNQGSIYSPINNSKGCGGIMRIAPAGLLFHNITEHAFQIAAELAAITHGHPSGYLPAEYLSALISYINNGVTLTEAILKTNEILKEYSGHEETLIAVQKAINLYKQGEPSFEKVELLGGGWVAEEALSISIYCALCYQNDFEKAINLSINHSGDSDSTGSITGNIVGLMVGKEGIPKRWIDNLSNCDVIQQIAVDLHTEVKGNGYAYFDEDWNRKYPTF